MRLIEFFKELRFDPNYHLGLGDVRLTVYRQEQIAEFEKTAIENIERLIKSYEHHCPEAKKESNAIKIAKKFLNEVK